MLQSTLPPSRQVRLAITPDHITRGLAHSFTHCPVALAIQDHWPSAKICVGSQFIYITQDTPGGFAHTLSVSMRLSHWINHYDVASHVPAGRAQPITILLDLTRNIACLTHKPTQE